MTGQNQQVCVFSNHQSACLSWWCYSCLDNKQISIRFGMVCKRPTLFKYSWADIDEPLFGFLMSDRNLSFSIVNFMWWSNASEGPVTPPVHPILCNGTTRVTIKNKNEFFYIYVASMKFLDIFVLFSNEHAIEETLHLLHTGGIW